jgi:hypothetical protein
VFLLLSQNAGVDAVLLKVLKQVDITEGRNNYYDLDSMVQLTIPVIAAEV